MRVRFGAAAIAGMVVGGGLGAFGATEHRAPSALDGLVKHRAGGAISLSPRAVDGLAPSDALVSRWKPFQARHGEGWSVHVDERTAMPALLSGPGASLLPETAARAATLDDVDLAARRFLEDNADAFGAWSDLLELDRAASAELREGHWQMVYRQRVNGVRVENARSARGARAHGAGGGGELEPSPGQPRP
jgi:hypothetical protein